MDRDDRPALLLIGCQKDMPALGCPTDRAHVFSSRVTSSIPPPEQQNVVLIRAGTLRQAERWIEFCEHCNADEAQIPFDWILDRVGSDSTVTDYILEEPAQCPRCRREILEQTFIEPE
jgi:hypothetical protein